LAVRRALRAHLGLHLSHAEKLVRKRTATSRHASKQSCGKYTADYLAGANHDRTTRHKRTWTARPASDGSDGCAGTWGAARQGQRRHGDCLSGWHRL